MIKTSTAAGMYCLVVAFAMAYIILGLLCESGLEILKDITRRTCSEKPAVGR